MMGKAKQIQKFEQNYQNLNFKYFFCQRSLIHRLAFSTNYSLTDDLKQGD